MDNEGDELGVHGEALWLHAQGGNNVAGAIPARLLFVTCSVVNYLDPETGDIVYGAGRLD